MSDKQTTDELTIMPEYCSDGLWVRGVAFDPESIPISDTLRTRLRLWCDWYEESELYMPKDRQPPFDLKGFAAEGLEIARAVKGELPDWRIIYLDAERSEGWPRLDVEREVFI